MCTAAEVKIYFTSLVDNKNKRKSSSYLKPNKNCNLTAWIDGCEPGWACRVVGEEKAVMNDTVNIPNRSENCQPCCAGFFCPKGITCMIRKSFLTLYFHLHETVLQIISSLFQRHNNFFVSVFLLS